MKYLVHNGSRSQKTRLTRSSQPKHGGHKQYICGSSLRVVHGRPVELSKEQLLEHIEEIRAKEEQGLLYVTDSHGSPVDLQTWDTKPLPPESPLPHPPLDSATNDKASGVPMPKYAGDEPPPPVFEMPVEPPRAAVDEPIVDVMSDLAKPAPAQSQQQVFKKKGMR